MFPRITGSELSKGQDSWRKKNGYACYYVSIDRKKTYHRDPAERDRIYNAESARRGLGIKNVAGSHVTVRDQFDLVEMRKLTDGRDVNLFEVFRAGMALLPQHDRPLEEAHAEFVAEKQKAVDAQALKACSLKQQRIAAGTMIREARFKLTSDVKNPAFKRWFEGRPLSPKGRHSYGKALGVFLNWLKTKKYLAENPLAEIEVPEPPPKRTIFSTKQTKRLFDVAQNEFPELVPILAVQWFAGVRPETSALIDYGDIDRRKKSIRLRVGKFAQGDVEFVERFPDTLWRWLPKRRAGPLAPPNLQHRLTAFHARLGFSKEKPWPQDVSRHTFVSHFVAKTGSLEAAAFTVNHKRAATTLKWYRQRVPEEEGVSYFKLRPAK